MEQFKSYVPAIAFLVAATSTLYLWGYWGSFDINILEFLGLSDILRVAAYPLASSLL